MLEDCNYNKIRLLHDLSRMNWYLKKHAKADAKKAGHEECHKLCLELEKDLEKHIEKLRKTIHNLCSKGKFR